MSYCILTASSTLQDLFHLIFIIKEPSLFKRENSHPFFLFSHMQPILKARRCLRLQLRRLLRTTQLKSQKREWGNKKINARGIQQDIELNK